METIKIGWKKYRIEKRKVDQRLVFDGQDCYGEIGYDDCVIWLNADNANEQNEATIIHEVLHAISDMYSLSLSEDIVERLANALYTTMKQNHYKLVEVK